MDKLTICLWFDREAEEAAAFYTGLFPNSRIDNVVHAPADFPNGKAGDALVVEFTLDGRKFMGLNGHCDFPFTEAVSVVIECEDQAEVDRYWAALSAHPESEQCGWCKDKYGLLWQVTPRELLRLIADPDRAKAKRAMEAMMEMKKIDLARIREAAGG